MVKIKDKRLILYALLLVFSFTDKIVNNPATVLFSGVCGITFVISTIVLLIKANKGEKFKLNKLIKSIFWFMLGAFIGYLLFL